MVWGLVLAYIPGYCGNYCLGQIVPIKAAAFSPSTVAELLVLIVLMHAPACQLPQPCSAVRTQV